MTDEEGGGLNALVLLQEPGEHARNLKAGLANGFDRAPEDEMKERQTVKACRRGTVFQQGNEEENKDWTHGTAKLRASTRRDEGGKLLQESGKQPEVVKADPGLYRAHEDS